MKDLHQLIIIVDGQIEHISTHHGEDAAGDALIETVRGDLRTWARHHRFNTGSDLHEMVDFFDENLADGHDPAEAREKIREYLAEGLDIYIEPVPVPAPARPGDATGGIEIITDVPAIEQQIANYANGCLSSTRTGFAVTVVIDAASNKEVDGAICQDEIAKILRRDLGGLPYDTLILIGLDED